MFRPHQQKVALECEKGNKKRMLANIHSAFASRGFDIVHPFKTSWLSQKGNAGNLHLLQRQPDKVAVGLLIGNTKNIWPHFVSSLNKDLPINPLDMFVEHEIARLTSSLSVNDIFFAHERSSDRIISFQKLASCTNLAHYSEELGLCVHKTYGTWFAFRAAVMLDGVCFADLGLEDARAPQKQLEFPCTEETKATAAQRMKRLLSGKDCDWLGLRDTVIVGRKWRYDAAQLQYHYAATPVERVNFLKKYLELR